MTPKSIDVHIICSRCGTAIASENRQMLHDVPAGLYRYFVSCHGAKDFGDHLTVAHTVENATLSAFPEEKAP